MPEPMKVQEARVAISYLQDWLSGVNQDFDLEILLAIKRELLRAGEAVVEAAIARLAEQLRGVEQ
jgi:hypothetical protein